MANRNWDDRTPKAYDRDNRKDNTGKWAGGALAALIAVGLIAWWAWDDTDVPVAGVPVTVAPTADAGAAAVPGARP